MPFASWLRSRGQQRESRLVRHHPRPARLAVRLLLESLEERCLLTISYSIADLGSLGGAATFGEGLNAFGQVAGDSQIGSGALHAFLFSNGMYDLGTLPGGSQSHARAVNASGQVAGWSDTAGSSAHAVLWGPDGTPTDLAPFLPPSTISYGRALNASGQVAGDALFFAGTVQVHQAFLYDGTAGGRDIGTLSRYPYAASYAYALNDSGQVAGYSDTDDRRQHAFLYDGTTMHDLGTLSGGTYSWAYALNASGQVAGSSNVPVGAQFRDHAFLYSGGAMRDLGVLPGYDDSYAWAVNASGQVAGDLAIGGPINSFAFLYDGSAMLNLNNLIPSGTGWVLTHAYALSDSGQIAGVGTLNGQAHAFLLTPLAAAVPAPPPAAPALPAPSTFSVANLGTLGGIASYGESLNTLGQVVGDTWTTGGAPHAFLFSNGLYDLGTLRGASSHARAVNASGQVAGYGQTVTGAEHAFLYDGTTMRDLGILLGGSYSHGQAVNSSGQVAGYADTTGGADHAFFYDGTTMNDLGTIPDGASSYAYAVNAAGQVAGYALLTRGGTRAFLYDGTQMNPLPTLGGTSSQAYAVNDAGQVAGSAQTLGNLATHAVVWNPDGTTTDLGTLGGTFGVAYAVNAAGQAAGTSTTVSGATHAFWYDGSAMRDLNGLIPANSGWVLTEAFAINDADQITGYGIFNGQTCAFLLTPLGSGNVAQPLAPAGGGRPLTAAAIVGSGPASSGPTASPLPPASAGTATGMANLPAPSPALPIVSPDMEGDGGRPAVPATAVGESSSTPVALSRFDALLSMGAGARSRSLAKNLSARDRVFAALSAANDV